MSGVAQTARSREQQAQLSELRCSEAVQGLLPRSEAWRWPLPEDSSESRELEEVHTLVQVESLRVRLGGSRGPSVKFSLGLTPRKCA